MVYYALDKKKNRKYNIYIYLGLRCLQHRVYEVVGTLRVYDMRLFFYTIGMYNIDTAETDCFADDEKSGSQLFQTRTVRIWE